MFQTLLIVPILSILCKWFYGGTLFGHYQATLSYQLGDSEKGIFKIKVTDLFAGLKEKEHFHIEGSGCSNKVMLYMYNNMYLDNVI